MRRYTCIVVLFLFMTKANAQQKKKPVFYLLPQVALLNGDNHANAQIALSGGIEKNGISYGLGVALDYYKIRTVPVFAALRASFGREKNVFAYVNAGPDFTWPLASQYTDHWLMGGGISRDRFTKGLYADGGLGYAFRFADKKELLISLGYSLKSLHQSYSETIWNDFPPYGTQVKERTLDYTLNRIALRVGVKL